MVAQFMIKLDWKEYNVNLDGFDTWLKANAGELYCGSVSYTHLQVWFTGKPSQEVQDAVIAKWESIEDDDVLVTSYKSKEAIEADVSAKKASAVAKLKALGLDDAEISAFTGQ